MNEHFPESDDAPQYSGPYEHDPRDPVTIGEMLESISDRIDAAARENEPVAEARNNLRNLLDPKVRGDRHVSDEELGEALNALGNALRGHKDEGTPGPQ